MDPNSSLFIRFQSVLNESGTLFSGSWIFYKLKSGDLISGGNQFCRMSELFGPSSCFSISKVFQTQILHHSLHFKVFCMIHECFSKVLKFLQIKEWGPNFWHEPILQNVWIIRSPVLFFNFKSFLDPNCSSLIGFQSILHESRRLFSGSWIFYKLNRGALISWVNQFCRTHELFGPPFCISIFKLF